KNQPTVRFLAQIANQALDVSAVSSRTFDRGNFELSGDFVDGAAERPSIVTGFGVVNQADVFILGGNFLQSREPFAAQRRLKWREAGDVAARACETFDIMHPDWIADHREYDRNGSMLGMDRRHRGVRLHEQHIEVERK